MSGSTRITDSGTWWSAVLESPRVSFAAPEPGLPSGEREYHDAREREFKAEFARAQGHFDRWLASIADTYGLVPVAEGGHPVEVYDWMRRLTVHVREPLDPDTHEALRQRLIRQWIRLQRERLDPDREGFNVVRWPDGSVEDVGGDPLGWPVPEDLPPEAATELLRRCAEIVAAAEAQGAIHPDLRPDQVRIDVGGVVCLTGYGEVADSAMNPGTPPPDWVGVQRRGLGALARQWGHATSEVPVPSELSAEIPPSDALERWLDAEWGLPFEPPAPRGGWSLEARLNRGARGVLRPCQRCGEPTLLGVYMSSTVDGVTRPICRTCADRALPRPRDSQLALAAVLVAAMCAAVALAAWGLGVF